MSHRVQIRLQIEFYQWKHSILVLPSVGLSILPALFWCCYLMKTKSLEVTNTFMSILFFFWMRKRNLEAYWTTSAIHSPLPIAHVPYWVGSTVFIPQVSTITKGSGYGNPVRSPKRRRKKTQGKHLISQSVIRWPLTFVSMTYLPIRE